MIRALKRFLAALILTTPVWGSTLAVALNCGIIYALLMWVKAIGILAGVCGAVLIWIWAGKQVGMYE